MLLKKHLSGAFRTSGNGGSDVPKDSLDGIDGIKAAALNAGCLVGEHFPDTAKHFFHRRFVLHAETLAVEACRTSNLSDGFRQQKYISESCSSNQATAIFITGHQPWKQAITQANKKNILRTKNKRGTNSPQPKGSRFSAVSPARIRHKEPPYVRRRPAYCRRFFHG